jgi:hypothetical protein
MRRIAIIGAGQSGLQLAVGLLRDGYEVHLYSDRTPEQWATSRLPSSTALFSGSLDLERALGLHCWDGQDPLIDAVYTRVAGPEGRPVIDWVGHYARHGQSIDQRIKFPIWMGVVERLGGEIRIGQVDVDALDHIAAEHDLTIVAAGKGDIAGLFELDRARMTYDGPQRRIGMCALVNQPALSPNGVSYNFAPGVGEAFGIPALTLGGPGVIWVLEGIPGGPMDCWTDVATPEDHLRTTLSVFERFFPWEAERHAKAELSDDRAWLSGAVPPLVRKPIGRLPSGRAVVGMADVVVLNDPCTGQGGNNAAHHAAVFHRLVVEQGERPFDATWMQRTFDEYWEYAQWPTMFTNAMLQRPPEHVLNLLGAAGQIPEIANRFAMAFDDPRDLGDFFFEADKANAYVAEAAARWQAFNEDRQRLFQ